MHRYNGADPVQRAEGTTHAVAAARRGELVVANLDGVYAVITDAFSHKGVEAINALKERTAMTVPVLVGKADTADGIAMIVGASGVLARTLMRDCWPGPLTIIGRVQPSLPWKCSPEGIVPVRMPMHPWTLDIVRALGPTANVPTHLAGADPHTSVDEVIDALGDAASVYLDGGPCLPDQTSTIVDVTGDQAIITREGAFTIDYLATLVPLAE